MKAKLFCLFLMLIMLFTACGEDSKKSASKSAVSNTENDTTASTTPSADDPKDDKGDGSYKEEIGISGYKKITLSGNKDDIYAATDFCYIEADKYFILMEKDIVVPGDLSENISLIIDELENIMGMPVNPVGYEADGFDMGTVTYGYNPWKDFEFGNKIPIFLIVDRNDEAIISGAAAEYVQICDYQLFSDELWNSVPSYYENEWRREGELNFTMYAHEISHLIALRNGFFNKIITEGSATYFAANVMKNIGEKLNGDPRFVDNSFNSSFDPEITPDNAEEMFINDFSELDTLHRGSEYTFGNFLCMLLHEEFGDDFFVMYNEEIKKYKFDETNYGAYTEEDLSRFNEAFKACFGDDIFVKFGKWYEANKDELYRGTWDFEKE